MEAAEAFCACSAPGGWLSSGLKALGCPRTPFNPIHRCAVRASAAWLLSPGALA